jgi:hypothetical protein
VTSRVRGAADDHRCPRGGGGGAHPGRGARGGHALVQTGAGQAGGDLADQRAPDLPGVRAAALAHGRLQDLPGPAADRQDPRRDRPVPGAADERGSLRSRREAARLTIPSLRSSRPVMRDADTRVDLHTDDTERRVGALLFSRLRVMGRPAMVQRASGPLCMFMHRRPRGERPICRAECVRHKLRARSLQRGWHHRGK